MQVVRIDPLNPDTKIVKKAAEILESGGIIVYPTDTAYALGANAFNPVSILKVYQLKGRDFSKPTHVVVRDWEMIKRLTLVTDWAFALYRKFLPGPLTMILKKKPIVPKILTANLPTLGVRIPNNKFTSRLSVIFKFPYTTPSANKSGGKTPYSIYEVSKELDVSKIDLAIDAGVLPKIPPSTIVDLTTTIPKILREGPISKEEIKKVLGTEIISP